MMNSPVEEIKNRLDITDVLSEYVQLQKAGANYRALCPFHSEKSPSFFISPGRQRWHCFGGCSEGGDIFAFIMKAEGVEFAEALRVLAKKAGVELPKKDPEFAKRESERKRLLDILELSAKFFERQLESKSGREAKQYLLKRGMTEESIAEWRIGYAPESNRALCEFLSSNGYSYSEIGKAGLLTRSDGEAFDRYRSRIIFPIFDLNDQIIAFGGRIFGKKDDGSMAKYVNSPRTPVYDKSRVLYGLNAAKMESRREDFCILVEGYTDVILVNQAGWKNVVSTSGTALTDQQLNLLKRYTSNLYAAFDRDSAGNEATKRGIDLAMAEGFRLNIVKMPQGKDPADVALEEPEMLKESIENAQSIFDFYFETTLAEFDKSTSVGKKDISDTLLPVIKKIPNVIEQAHWIQRLADELDVKEEDIREALKDVKEVAPKKVFYERKGKVEEKREKTRQELLEERMLSLVFKSPDCLNEITQEDEGYITSFAKSVLEGMRKNPGLETEGFKDVFSEEQMEYVDYLAMKADIEEEEAEWKRDFHFCLKELKKLHILPQLESLSREMKRAEEANDEDEVTRLAEQHKQLLNILHTN